VSLLEHAIDAHGGLARWREIQSIDVTLRCGGIAMALKGQPSVLRHFTATVDPRRPHVELHGIGTFDASIPRPAGMARRPHWGTDDVVHFAGYALWGYITAPFLLAEPDVTVRELPRCRLRVDFPDRIPSHSRRQTFHFSPAAVLQRLDYTAEVFLGPFGRAQALTSTRFTLAEISKRLSGSSPSPNIPLAAGGRSVLVTELGYPPSDVEERIAPTGLHCRWFGAPRRVLSTRR
jgi:hypothetical protein